MSERDESVFPIPGEWHVVPRPDLATHETVYTGSFGLSKRELFAALAMHAHIVANLTNGQMITGGDAAKGALLAADGLLAALAKDPPCP